MTVTLPRREQVPQEHTWDLSSLFADGAAWEQAYRAFEGQLPSLAPYAGRLAESPTTLLAWLQVVDRLKPALDQLSRYATLQADQDTANQANAALVSRAGDLAARFGAVIAFAEPELLALDPALIERFMAQEPALQLYKHYFDNLRRRRAHVRSAEVEELLAQSDDPLGVTWNAYSMLADADLRFAPAHGADGRPAEVAQGTIRHLLESRDRALRAGAWNAFADGYLGVRNTMAALLAGDVRANVFRARARRYESARAAALDRHNLPIAVFDNVIDACNRHLPIWHRYWEIRRRALGVELLESYDVFAPLAERQPEVPYQQAVEWICAAMAPLGRDYVRVMRDGLTRDRWVDIYPNQGKRSGAYAGGAFGAHPLILMSYTDNLTSMSTLAHEIGHAMHRYLSDTTQPYIYSRYAIFAAEVASNFNQALVRGHLLKQDNDRDFQIALIEEAMSNFHRYLFLMPILAQFELQIHQRAEQSQGLTADTMSGILVELFRKGYGPAVRIDEPRVGITWAQFPHMYMNFYVFQYASGIAAANALAEGLLAGEPGAAGRYVQFLRAGSSLYPLDVLKLAGLDMTTAEPMDRAFGVLERFVDRLDQLI